MDGISVDGERRLQGDGRRPRIWGSWNGPEGKGVVPDGESADGTIQP